MELNSREIAILIWGLGLLGFVVMKAKAWPALLGVIRAFWTPFILLPIGLMALYVEALVWLLWRFGLWTTDNLKTTLVWFITFAVAWVFDTKRWEADPNQDAKVTLKEVLNVTVLVTFVTEFYTFNLIGELIFVPVVSFMALVAGVAVLEERTRIVAKLFNGILAIVGFSLLGYAAYRLLGDLNGFATVGTGREFAVPGLLSLLFIPFMYIFNIWNAYSGVLRTMNISIQDEKVRRYARQRAFFWFGLNTGLLQRWRALLFRTKTDSIETLRRSVGTMKAARLREWEPPLVAAADGWSPHLARQFLVSKELTPGPYNPSFDGEWSASSPYRELGSAIFPDNLAFYITGTEDAATRLRIKLNVNNPGDEDDEELSRAAFLTASAMLIAKALGEEDASIVERLDGTEGEKVEATHASLWFKSEPFVRSGYSLMLTVEHKKHRNADWEEPKV